MEKSFIKKKENLLIKNKKYSNKDPKTFDVPIGKHVLDIPESTAKRINDFINKNKFLPSLMVTRVWIEKKEKSYRIHIGDLDDTTFNIN